jgi:hypothetical protein
MMCIFGVKNHTYSRNFLIEYTSIFQFHAKLDERKLLKP